MIDDMYRYYVYIYIYRSYYYEYIDIVNLYVLTFAPRMPPRMNIFKLLLSSPKNHRNSSAAEVVPAKLEPIGALGFGRCSSFFFC